MNIYAIKGFRVKCTTIKLNGYVFDDEKAEKFLELNKIYTIEKTEVGSSSTKVYLEEIEDEYFNSSFFDDVVEQSIEDDEKHMDYFKYN